MVDNIIEFVCVATCVGCDSEEQLCAVNQGRRSTINNEIIYLYEQ